MPKQPVNLDLYAAEVRSGLVHEKKRLDEAVENQAFFDHDAYRYIPRREAETEFDFEGRPKRFSGLTRQCIDILTDHLYNPGPTRQVVDADAAQAFLETVYDQNLINSLMQEADALSSLNDVVAIQVDAGDGDFDERPIDLIMWGGEEFHAWVDPANAKRPIVVCTIDRHDARARYRLWSDTEVRTYLTQKTLPGQTSGGVAAEEIAREQHNYGCLPFSFVHYQLPTRYFWTSGIGTFLRRAEVRVDDRLSRLDESILKHLNPIPVAEGVDPSWNPVIEPGRFLRLPPGSAFSGVAGDYSGAVTQPRLYFLQVTLDVPGAWEDLLNYINQALQAAHVPLTAVRMEQTGVASGIAILAEQAPLLTRACKRRVPAQHYETELAKTILTCAGNHYGKAELVAAAKTLSLSLAWPEPRIPIPGPDRNEDDDWRLERGITSRICILQERDGLTEAQAIERLKKVAQHRALEQQIEMELGPKPPVPPAPDDEPDEEHEDGNRSVDEGNGQDDQDVPAATDGEPPSYGNPKSIL